MRRFLLLVAPEVLRIVSVLWLVRRFARVIHLSSSDVFW